MNLVDLGSRRIRNLSLALIVAGALVMVGAVDGRAQVAAVQSQAPGASSSIPRLFGETTATPNAEVPSYKFAQHLLARGAKVSELEQGVLAVNMEGDDFPSALFSQWDEFQAFGKCSKEATIVCEMDVFDFDAETIKRYLVPFDLAVHRATYDTLVGTSSNDDRAGVEIPASIVALPGSGAATRSRDVPSSGLANYLVHTAATLSPLEPGVLAAQVQGGNFPNLIFASGEDFEAVGICVKRMMGTGCAMSVFDYEDEMIKRYHVSLDLAIKQSTYEGLLTR